MKFLFVTIQPFHKYASYKRATGMGDALAELGHEVYITALDCQENRERLKLEAPHCTHLLFKPSNAFIEVFFKLKAIWRVKPDFVYSPTYGLRNLMGFKIFFPKGTKLLQEINELNSILQPDFRPIWKCIELLGMVEADCQICGSRKLIEYTNRMCKMMHINRKTKYLPFGFPPYVCESTTHKNDNMPKHVVFLGTLYEYYGIYEILSAVKLLTSEGINLILDIIGSGQEVKNVATRIESLELSKVARMHGYIPEDKIDEYLKQADVFISPMRNTLQDWHRCPSKIFYYIAYNKPIVTCKIGDPYDSLGQYGFYYEPMDIIGMANSIREALSLPHFSYPREFIQKHSWAARANDLCEYLNCHFPKTK